MAFYLVAGLLIGVNVWNISPLLMFVLGVSGYVTLLIGWIRAREYYGIEDE
ncbi:MAG: hypothetical protein P1U83_02465 [Roseovarius sp.]|nr:hypothetical protein [Roseovarius sp.]